MPLEHLCDSPGHRSLINRWEFYTGGGGWRWRVFADENGTLIAAASQGYTRREDVVSNARRMGYTGPNPKID